MSSKNNDKLSVANVLAVIGLAALGVITFFGIFINTGDGTLGFPILKAVGIVAVLGLLLWMSIMAKQKDSDVEKWKYVEWGSIFLFIAVSALCIMPVQRFSNVVFQKGKLQQEAKADVATLKNLYTEYNTQSEEFISKFVNQYTSYTSSKQMQLVQNDSLSEYSKVINPNYDPTINNCDSIDKKAIQNWGDKAIGTMNLEVNPDLNGLDTEIDEWNLMKVSSIVNRMPLIIDHTWKSIMDKIQTAKDTNKLIPVIHYDPTKRNNQGLYFLAGYAEFDLGDKPVSTLSKDLKEMKANSVTGWAIYILLTIMILINYLVAPRSNNVGPKKSGNKLDSMDL